MTEYRFIIKQEDETWYWVYSNTSRTIIRSTRDYNNKISCYADCWSLKNRPEDVSVRQEEEDTKLTLEDNPIAESTTDDLNEDNIASMSNAEIDHQSFDVTTRSDYSSFLGLLGRGRRHRTIAENADVRISISGIRGKSSVVKITERELRSRGYTTIAKITGEQPTLIYNGVKIPIDRGTERVMQYENHSVLRSFLKRAHDEDNVALILENQGISEYTTRNFNESFSIADIVMITNIRPDHADTLGTYNRLSRAFGRTVSSEKDVIICEQDKSTLEYLDHIMTKYGANVHRVNIPTEFQSHIAAETVHGVNKILELLDLEQMSREEVRSQLSGMQPRWKTVDGVPIGNIANANDVESTQMLMNSLFSESRFDPPFTLFLYLRGDRRSRSVEFLQFSNKLWDEGQISNICLTGDSNSVFKRKSNIPNDRFTIYDKEDDPQEVLDSILETSRDYAEQNDRRYNTPILIMGNTVPDLMRDIGSIIEERAATDKFQWL